LSKSGKEYLNAETCKLYTSSVHNFETIGVLRAFPSIKTSLSYESSNVHVKSMCYSQIWQNFGGDEYLCKFGKEYSNASICKLVLYSGPSRATAGPGETFSRGPQTFYGIPLEKKFMIFFQNGTFLRTLYFWQKAGPPNVAGPGVAKPPTPPYRRACIYSLQYSEPFGVLHVFLPLTIAELSALKQVRFFGLPCIILKCIKYIKNINLKLATEKQC